MRVAICYPPLRHQGRVPVLTQSRIFSFTHSPEIRIYPLVMAQAATLLQRGGCEVGWLDGIAAGEGAEKTWSLLEGMRPRLVVLETKVTMIRRHWNFIRELKGRLPGALVAVVGDHVSYFPEETLRMSPADFVVTGGDYDIGLAALVKCLRAGGTKLPRGVWARRGNHVIRALPPRMDADLDGLPWIDRELTQWSRYGEAYLHRPVAYVLSGRGCGGVKRAGSCTFCIWQYAFWRRRARLRDPRDVAREIAHLYRSYGVREVFDDNEAGGMWDHGWLEAFADELVRQDVAGRVRISSNCRADSVTVDRCRLMRKAGYRLLKIALESGNDDTLKRILKDETVAEIARGVKTAKDHGFAVMVTAMVGFPWEDEAAVQRTYETARELLFYRARRGDCLEANVVIPYPGTPLHSYMRDNGWLTVRPDDYDAYGLSKPVVRSPVDPVSWAQRLWRLHRDPRFVLRCLTTMRSWDDVRLSLRGVRSLVGHERDYGKGRVTASPV